MSLGPAVLTFPSHTERIFLRQKQQDILAELLNVGSSNEYMPTYKYNITSIHTW